MDQGLRLAITLRFMATGEAYKSMSLTFCVGPNYISKLVLYSCEAIVQGYMKEIIACPSSPKEWNEVADGFSKTGNFNHTFVQSTTHLRLPWKLMLLFTR